MSDMNQIEEAIIEQWGERCPDYAEGCYACDAWQLYDEMNNAYKRSKALDELARLDQDAGNL
jgi:hypothetical protein